MYAIFLLLPQLALIIIQVLASVSNRMRSCFGWLVSPIPTTATLANGIENLAIAVDLHDVCARVNICNFRNFVYRLRQGREQNTRQL